MLGSKAGPRAERRVDVRRVVARTVEAKGRSRAWMGCPAYRIPSSRLRPPIVEALHIDQGLGYTLVLGLYTRVKSVRVTVAI